MPPASSAPRPVDPLALRRVRQCLSTAQAAPWLHGEVARRMADRLPVIVQQPRIVLDWSARAGGSAAALAAACPRAERWSVEAEAPGRPDAERGWRPGWWPSAARSTFTPETVPTGQAQMLWANMMLHWAPDPQGEMQRWHDVLAVDGFLMFSTLGPGTLSSLRALYADAGWPPPHADFVDMHDLGDMLVRCGFADPVMDQEVIQLNWADAGALLAELRSLGGNADPRRFAGLRTPRWRDALLARLNAAARPALEFEVVYGHAFRPLPRISVAQESKVGLQDMRSILRRRRDG